MREKLPLKYKPRHDNPNPRKPYERLENQSRNCYEGVKERDRSPPKSRDVVQSLPAKGGLSSPPKVSRRCQSSNSPHESRKRKSPEGTAVIRKQPEKKVTIRDPEVLSTHIVPGRSESNMEKAKAMVEKHSEPKGLGTSSAEVIAIELNGEEVMITDEALEQVEAEVEHRRRRLMKDGIPIHPELQQITEGAEASNPYSDQVDFGTGDSPNGVLENDGDENVHRSLEIVALENVSSAEVISMENDGSGKENERCINGGYPFRFSLSQKAHNQINDLVYLEVAGAVGKTQKILENVVAERDDFEKRWKDATQNVVTEANYRRQIEDFNRQLSELKKQLAELKKQHYELNKQHYEDQEMFELEINDQTRRAQLAVEEMQKAQSATFEMRADFRHCEELLASAREQVKETTCRIEAIQKFVESHNLKVPTELLKPVGKYRPR